MNYEELAQALIDCLHASEEARFHAGDIVCRAQGVTLSALASSCGRSVAYLSALKKVAETFPPETRAQDQSWSLHLYAARTADPEKWLEDAVANGWSVRELRKALIEAGEMKPRSAKEKICPNCGYDLRGAS